MTVIKQEDLIQSVADALQYISYYHPTDFIQGMAAAYEKEQSPAARDAIAQILINSRMCAEGHRPICQDTGIGTLPWAWKTWSTKVSGAPPSTSTTPCAPASSPIPPAPARTHKTIRQ